MRKGRWNRDDVELNCCAERSRFDLVLVAKCDGTERMDELDHGGEMRDPNESSSGGNADQVGLSRRPRLWTVFAAIPIVFAVLVATQIFAVLIFIAWQVSQGEPIQQVAESLSDSLTTPVAFILLGVPA